MLDLTRLPGQSIDRVLHTVGPEAQRVVALGEDGCEIALQSNIYGEVLQLMTGTVACDLDQPHVRLTVVVVDDLCGHRLTPAIGRVCTGADQQRDMIVLLRILNNKSYCYLRKKAFDAPHQE